MGDLTITGQVVAEGSDTRPLMVLLVEDEPSVRWPIAEYLRSTGWAVIETSTAVEAMSVLNSDSHIDVVFTDFKLPGGPTGVMLAQWLESRIPDLPVLLTSRLTDAYPGFARELGASFQSPAASPRLIVC